ncbi:MAG: DUF1800 domain-containing protein [Phycisphaerae bacterium]|nr:DUF1800 domain-containing protein [Phycisphaerae bacterium]
MPNPTLKALAPEKFDYWKAHHLLNRAGFGGTPAQVRSLANLGLDRAVDLLVDFRKIDADPIESSLFDSNIIRPATDEERRAQQEARRNNDEAALERFQRMRNEAMQSDRRQLAEMRKWWLARMIESPRPLEERLVLLWHGHFATGYRTIEDSWHMFRQNEFFRANAAGNFGDLAYGIIRDPAMLRYLDNNRNRRQSPNENLARELMELFTMGEGEYTERDIKEGARALTGYTYEDDEFRFDQGAHDRGPKAILGRNGSFDGDDFVRIILESKPTAEFVSLKLYRAFVSDLPGALSKDRAKFVEAMGRRLRDSKYELQPVLKALFKSEHFYDPEHAASLIKSPVQLVVQAVRGLHTPPRSLSALASALDLMGQDLFQPPSVKGWDGGRAWINTATLFVRQNVLVYLVTGVRPAGSQWEVDDAEYDPSHLVAHLGDKSTDPESVSEYLLRFMLGAPPAEERRERVRAFLRERGDRIDKDRLLALLCLISAMPEYQLC